MLGLRFYGHFHKFLETLTTSDLKLSVFRFLRCIKKMNGLGFQFRAHKSEKRNNLVQEDPAAAHSDHSRSGTPEFHPHTLMPVTVSPIRSTIGHWSIGEHLPFKIYNLFAHYHHHQSVIPNMLESIHRSTLKICCTLALIYI